MLRFLTHKYWWSHRFRRLHTRYLVIGERWRKIYSKSKTAKWKERDRVCALSSAWARAPSEDNRRTSQRSEERKIVGGECEKDKKKKGKKKEKTPNKRLNWKRKTYTNPYSPKLLSVVGWCRTARNNNREQSPNELPTTVTQVYGSDDDDSAARIDRVPQRTRSRKLPVAARSGGLEANGSGRRPFAEPRERQWTFARAHSRRRFRVAVERQVRAVRAGRWTSTILSAIAELER